MIPAPQRSFKTGVWRQAGPAAAATCFPRKRLRATCRRIFRERPYRRSHCGSRRQIQKGRAVRLPLLLQTRLPVHYHRRQRCRSGIITARWFEDQESLTVARRRERQRTTQGKEILRLTGAYPQPAAFLRFRRRRISAVYTTFSNPGLGIVEAPRKSSGRVAGQSFPIQPAHFQPTFCLKVAPLSTIGLYLPGGAFRRSSSAKFIRTVRLVGILSVAVSSARMAASRLPSGAMS